MNKASFGVIGGDLRSAYAALYLIQRGYEVRTAGLEKAGLVPQDMCCDAQEACAADYVLFPLPLLGADGGLFAPFAAHGANVWALAAMTPKSSILLGGRVPASMGPAACGRVILDYYNDESLQLRNALPTAEGTLALLLAHLPVTVQGASVAVTGFGRTAQSLALLLRAVGAKVTVFARREEARAHAESLGLFTLPAAQLCAGPLLFDALVNTAPAPLVTEAVLGHLNRNCYLIDIASAPGGIDLPCAAAMGFSGQDAPALPGKTAPRTAGENIARTVLEMLRERGERV